MGLIQAGESRRLLPEPASWLTPGIIAAVSALIAVSGDAGREWLSYSRPEIDHGQVWRLLSGHVTHLGVSHLIYNLVGMSLIWYLVSSHLSRTQWPWVVAASIVSMDLGFWFIDTDLHWYVGTSGLSHGLLAAGIVAGIRSHRLEVWALLVILVLKIVWEQLVGPMPGSAEASGGGVIVNSHAYGAVGGAIAATIIMIRVRARASI